MKRNLANIVSGSRIAASIVLFFFSAITNAFIWIYIFCGFTDLIDGPIARKTGSTSILGASLDTAGDVLTYVALAKILFVQSLLPLWILLWFGATVIGFIASAFISKKRHGKFYFVHSLFGKILGVSLFTLPFSLRIFNQSILCIAFICAVSSIAAVESIVIQLKSKKAETDVISISEIEK